MCSIILISYPQTNEGEGAVMTPEKEALQIFQSLSTEEQLTYLDRLHALLDMQAPAPAPLEKEI